MTRHAVDLPEDEFTRIFGPKPEKRETVRSRLCNVCGDWHRLDRPWPHNCRAEAPPRSDLASPMVAPPFVPFKTGVLDGAEIIGSRRDKINFMDKHDLVEWDAGVKPDADPSPIEQKQQFVRDFKRSIEMDPLAIEPVDRIGETDTDGAGDIAIEDIEVAK